MRGSEANDIGIVMLSQATSDRLTIHQKEGPLFSSLVTDLRYLKPQQVKP